MKIIYMIILKITQERWQILLVNVSLTGYTLMYIKPAYTEGVSSVCSFNSAMWDKERECREKKKIPPQSWEIF